MVGAKPDGTNEVQKSVWTMLTYTTWTLGSVLPYIRDFLFMPLTTAVS